MQTAEQQIALWPHPQMLLAAHAQRAPRDAHRFAYLGDEERLVRVLLHNPAKAAHDNRVLPLRQSILRASRVARQSAIAWINACSRLRAASGWAMISGASSARPAAVACSRCSRAIAVGGGVSNIASR